MSDYIDGAALSLASLVIAIASLVLAYIFYRRGRRFKEPTWDSEGRFVLEEHKPGLSQLRVFYGEHQVENVSIDRVVFWNRGRETLHGGDIVSSDPLRVEPPDDGMILGYIRVSQMA